MKMLFEGLTRLDPEGKPVEALAESISLSEDNLEYTFHLKNTQWSDGRVITANDFIYSWQQQLEPDFPSSSSFMLYLIKNAKRIKEGLLSASELGVRKEGEKKLIVTLEHPTPYFLHLTALPTYFPIPGHYDQKASSWSNRNLPPSNGPFSLLSWNFGEELQLEKNPYYWDASTVTIEKLYLVMVDEVTEHNMFENQELNWAGSPLSFIPTDALSSLKREKKVAITKALGTHFFRFNTTLSPFNNTKLRKAFSYALNRQRLVDHITQADQQPALGFVPPGIQLQEKPYFKDNNIKKARKLFEKALKEANLTKETFPPITISYSTKNRDNDLVEAIQQQWQKAFDIKIHLEKTEEKLLLEKRKNGNYQIITSSWIADFQDPINFLELFKEKEGSNNHTGWENQEYRSFLELARRTPFKSNRQLYLLEAEEVLMKEMPIAPIFFYTFAYRSDPSLKNVYLSKLGHLDFKWASVKKGVAN